MSSRRLQDMSSRRLEDVFSVTIFRLPRRLKDVLREVLKTSWRRLEDVLEDVKLLHWRRVEDIFKTCLEDVFKTSWRPTNICWVVISGAHQGGPESPCLFNLYIDFVMRVFMNNCMKDDPIRFFKHQYRINLTSISRGQQLRMRNENGAAMQTIWFYSC